MTNSKAKARARSLVCVLLLGCASRGVGAQAQPSVVGVVNNYTTTGYYEPPRETQMKFRLTGVEMRPQSADKLLFTQMKLETFGTNGEREIVVQAPECTYDSSKRLASSPGRLQVQTGDGQASVEGQGFLWTSADSFLTISNEVRALVQRGGTNAAAAATQPPLEITSRRFEFDLKKRLGVFREQVRGDDPEMEFACGVLTASASTNGNSFDVITAEAEASISGKTDGRSAKADHFVYTRADERIELSGNAAWKQDRQEGRANRATLHRADQSFEADGNVAMKLPRESVGLGGFFATPTNATAPAAEGSSPLVDLFADHFQTRSNFTIAQGAVRVVDGTNRLSCGRLTVQVATAASPEETALAEQDVVVERGDGRLQAGRAVYAKSADTIVFTDDPRWNLDQTEGRADQVTLHSQTSEVDAEGNVDVKVPLGGEGASLLAFFPDAGNTNHGPQVIEVFARSFMTKERLVTFLGGARAHETPITGSEARLQSDALAVQLAADRRHAERITAINHVVFEQGTIGVTNGPAMYRKLTTQTLTAQPPLQEGRAADLVAEGEVRFDEPGLVARGGHATYTGATEIMELTVNPSLAMEFAGNPNLKVPAGTINVTNATVLTLNRVTGGYSADGPYRTTFAPHAVEPGGRK